MGLVGWPRPRPSPWYPQPPRRPAAPALARRRPARAARPAKDQHRRVLSTPARVQWCARVPERRAAGLLKLLCPIDEGNDASEQESATWGLTRLTLAIHSRTVHTHMPQESDVLPFTSDDVAAVTCLQSTLAFQLERWRQQAQADGVGYCCDSHLIMISS